VSEETPPPVSSDVREYSTAAGNSHPVGVVSTSGKLIGPRGTARRRGRSGMAGVAYGSGAGSRSPAGGGGSPVGDGGGGGGGPPSLPSWSGGSLLVVLPASLPG
jgi:hypothetical protein